MSIETKNKTLIEKLFTAGSHFGFTKARRHPTVVPYLFCNKQGTDIFDLEKTSELLLSAGEILKEAGKTSKTVLFVGTKAENSVLVKAAAEKAEMPYVTNRWIGGTLTNFSEIKKRLNRFSELTSQQESGELEKKYTKKERVMIGREYNKLDFNFGGIKDMSKLPNLMVVVDPRHNYIAVEEANQLNIPVIGVTSSDCNLRNLQHPVVVNDSLQSSVTLVLAELTDALIEGKSEAVTKEVDTKAKE